MLGFELLIVKYTSHFNIVLKLMPHLVDLILHLHMSVCVCVYVFECRYVYFKEKSWWGKAGQTYKIAQNFSCLLHSSV